MLQLKLQIPEIGSKFLTVEQFKEAAQQGAKAAGFAFSISSSKLLHVEKDDRVPFVTLQCVMGGNYRNNHKISEETRKRTKFTKRQNCSVSLRAVLNENIGVWVVTYYKSQHNHELLPSSQVYCFHQHRILNMEQKELVHTIIRNVINERDQIKNALNEDGSMQNLFFTHIEVARQVAICPEVLIVDATYKTNLYKLPLVNAIGVSNIGNTKALKILTKLQWLGLQMNRSTHIHEVFVSNKDLALQKAANNVFPTAKKMFCIWHMLAQNLRTTCRKFFDSDEDYDKFLLSVQKVAYSEKMSEVEKAFDEIKQTIAKSRNPTYIQNYFKERKKNAE
ncbi:26692_t:CDS:2, partial [Gigaspora margarita]